jgi:hypothetical protein
MTQIKRIGIDTSKAVFTLHGTNRADQPVLPVNLRRAQMLSSSRNARPPSSPWKRVPVRTFGTETDRAWPQRAPDPATVRETPSSSAPRTARSICFGSVGHWPHMAGDRSPRRCKSLSSSAKRPKQ